MIKNNLDILKNLNDEQLEVVKDTKHNIRIIAGPGSGKTRTLTHKIAYLIKELNVKSYNILAVTFTNKASKEMKERVQALIGNNQTRIFTFHGLCANILYREHEYTRFGANFHIIDRKDQEMILKKLYKKRDISPKTLRYWEVLKKFSSFSDLNKDVATLYEELDSGDESQKLFIDLYDEYIQEKVASQALDFNDIISETLNLFKNEETVLERWSNYFSYIFVDEYQDTNESQYKLLLLLKNQDSIINVVGDPDQNIYSFRGSKLKFILNFEKDFDNPKTIILNKNYRSNSSIVELSNDLIKKNTDRVENELISVNGQTEKIFYYESNDKISEAKWIVRGIQSIKRRNPNVKIAILYRNNFASAIIENELLFHGISYSMLGSVRFSERKEIKEVISYILFLLKHDDMSLEKIISVPSRKVGPVALSKLNNIRLKEKKDTIWNAIKDSDDKLVTNNYKIMEFIEETKKSKARLDNNEEPTLVIKSYLSSMGFMEFYRNEDNRTRNINEFLEMMLSFTKEYAGDDAKSILIRFVNENQLFSTTDDNFDENKIVMSTIHASKGLEFDAVFLACFNEGIIPNRYATKMKDIEEERRIAYVAITRAKKYLYISSHRGQDYSGNALMVSSFINDISSHIEIEYDKKLENSFEVGDNYRGEINYFKSNAFIVGDLVYHSSFGKGTVIQDKDESVLVSFEGTFGTKEIVKNHTSLKKIE